MEITIQHLKEIGEWVAIARKRAEDTEPSDPAKVREWFEWYYHYCKMRRPRIAIYGSPYTHPEFPQYPEPSPRVTQRILGPPTKTIKKIWGLPSQAWCGGECRTEETRGSTEK